MHTQILIRRVLLPRCKPRAHFNFNGCLSSSCSYIAAIKPASGESRMMQTGFHSVDLWTFVQWCSDSLSNVINEDLCSQWFVESFFFFLMPTCCKLHSWLMLRVIRHDILVPMISEEVVLFLSLLSPSSKGFPAVRYRSVFWVLEQCVSEWRGG